MYLSKLKLDLKSSSARQALRDCEDMHRNIQSIFESDRLSQNVLYRVLYERKDISVYVMSDRQITEDMIKFSSGFILLGSVSLESVKDSIKEGSVYQFDLVAYPSEKKHIQGKKNSLRKYLSDYDDQLSWIHSKAEQSGFRIIDLGLSDGNPVSTKKKGTEIRLNQTRFYGRLQVENIDKFLESWRCGIGPEKAYGFGMLLLSV